MRLNTKYLFGLFDFFTSVDDVISVDDVTTSASCLTSLERLLHIPHQLAARWDHRGLPIRLEFGRLFAKDL